MKSRQGNMPELPEVETIKRQLSRKIKGKKIKAVEIRLPKLVRTDLKEFKKKIKGAKIKEVKRRAKLVMLELDNGYSLVIHLKLTGQLIYQKPKTKHTHLIYTFTDGSKLNHNDMRQFGYVKLIKTDKIEELMVKQEKYGPEPLQKSFTLKLFQELLKKKPKAKIKPLLMDQTFVAGLGNIYSDEVLFFAQVRPDRIVKTLKEKEIRKIYQGIKKILKAAISRHGTSSDTYLDTAGQKGKYLPLLKIYQRTDQPCFGCQTKIKRIKMGGRSAHFCPQCQK